MSQLTFSQVAEQWLKSATIGLSFAWTNQLTSNVKHLNGAFGNKNIDDVKPNDIDALIKTLSIYNPNTKKPSSKRLLKSISNVANQIFDFALENDFARKNPAKKSSKRIPKNAPTKVVEGLNDFQQSVVMDFVHPTRLASVIMMFMGLRTGELLALQWKDFDFENLIIDINKRCSRVSSNKFTVKKGTKNGKCRQVSIPPSVAKWLESEWLQSKTSLVVTNKKGKIHTPTSWRNCWNSYQNELNYYVYKCRCKKVGIEPKNKYSPTGIPDMNISFNAHQLRHIFATMLYISKVDVLTAKELLGHSDVQTTLSIYTHLDEKFKTVNILKFDNYIQNELLKAVSL